MTTHCSVLSSEIDYKDLTPWNDLYSKSTNFNLVSTVINNKYTKICKTEILRKICF